MTKRPVFIPSNDRTKFVKETDISFKWHAGFSVSQKQKSIQEFHSAITKETELTKILEISTKSENALGVNASAFNLKLSIKNGEKSSVESFYQGSKIFEKGGPYTDIYKMNAYESKIKSNGFICGHDYVMGNWSRSNKYGVIESVNEFLVKKNWKLVYWTSDFTESNSFAIQRIGTIK